ncbi:hypothetical protein [Erwinia rhapontici]|uniref:hypothetical protein n=1 Tax=Erwinia rhapontici TaxID=55212 RepID=UPI0013314117|nr:hypothetical protein [Erwinia rhapontici]MBP2155741.1 hypothetical protein [Erwinia rhapontici]
MSEHFLLTYTVSNVGPQSQKHKSDDVRDEIRDLDFDKVIDLGRDFHGPFHNWDKLSLVETTIKGHIIVEGRYNDDKQKSATKAVSKIFIHILKKHEASARTTVIHCAMLVNDAGDTFEFDVKY